MTDDFGFGSYGNANGALVLARRAAALAALDRRQLVRRLATSGYVLLRGFDTSLQSFSAFVSAYSSRITLDPARAFHGGSVAQKVDAGIAAMGLHLENGNSPFRPDLTWFFCERAARSGSQTTVCDGCRVWESTSELTRARFRDQRILYRRRVEADKWKTFVYHQKQGAAPLESIGPSDLLSLIEGQAATSVAFDADGSIEYSFSTPAVHDTLFGAGPAWANSVFGPSYNYEAPRITFGDEAAIPAPLLEEMHDLTARLTEEIAWQDGDVLLIDNTRVMHGRRTIEDTGRRIFNALSYVDRALLPERT